MINALLGKVADIFKKDYLFASFLPALVFFAVLMVTVGGVAGFGMMWEWLEAMSALQKATLSTAIGVLVVVFAYLLNALRPICAHFWSGTSNFPLFLPWGFHGLARLLRRQGFRRLQARATRSATWREVLDWFTAEVDKTWKTDGTQPSDRQMKWLMFRVRALDTGLGKDTLKAFLDPVVRAFEKYSGEALKDVYRAVKMTLMEFQSEADMRQQTAIAALDRKFGTFETIRPTILGNVVEAYNQYSFKRYKIEAEIFWPRLRKVIPDEYMALLDEPRILLDFSLTMASLAALYAVCALLVGPWLWFNLPLWIGLALVAIGVAVAFYGVGLVAAHQLGELVRASFDLFRLDLMTDLGRPRPTTFRDERRQWEEVSQVVAYGDDVDFAIAAAGAGK